MPETPTRTDYLWPDCNDCIRAGGRHGLCMKHRAERWAELYRQGNASRTTEEGKRIAADMNALLALPLLPPA